MPSLPLHRCQHCRRLVRGSCDCQTAERNGKYNAKRSRTDSNQYDRKWRVFREWFLQTYPYCEDCLQQGRETPAAEVHHIVKVKDDPSRRLDEDNCKALCKACHSVRTRRGE
jgi:5-methylcytosine-specific restriction protein A